MWTFGAACVYDIVRHKRALELKVRAPARGGESQITVLKFKLNSGGILIMKNKILVTMGLIAALMATGCAGNAGSNPQPEAAQSAETV